MSNDRIVVGIDVGTTKVAALIAEVSDDDHLEVIGTGIVPSRGLKKGVVVSPEEVVESIISAVNKAEQQSGFKIVSAFVGISGAHISTQTSQGVVAVRHPERQISPDDVQRAIEAARVVQVPNDREIVHVLPRHYVVDGQDGIKNPIGMVGHRIEVQTTVVSGAMTSVNNLVRCVERAGVGIDSLVLQPVAAGEAVLTEAEREIGVTLIDIGSGTTDVGIFVEGALLFACVLPVGGFQVSNDLAVGLRTPFAAAEEIKIRHGYALPELLEDDRTIDVSAFDTGDGRPVSRLQVSEIIEPRLEETFELVLDQLDKANLRSLPAGVVLCGGTAQLGGIRRLAAEVFHAPVRIGTSTGIYGLTDQISTPAYATSVGLLKWGLDQEFEPSSSRGGLPLSNIGSAVTNWLRNFLP
ncbi:MAG: cell division protein FtsA [Chloroflexi bacterium]|nr:cell division protein FtsA [Chloroflexota bacterium]